MEDNLTPDQRADLLASQQHSVISRRQALEVGLTGRRSDRRLASGRWVAPVRGIYVVAGAPRTGPQQLTLALLAAPLGSVGSSLISAALFGLAYPPAARHTTRPRAVAGRASSTS